MVPKLQCPNCLQFELGFIHLKPICVLNHQEGPHTNRAIQHTEFLMCNAFDCAHTGSYLSFRPKSSNGYSTPR